MQNYPVGAPVTVTLPLKDLNGSDVTPTALSYVVEDGSGEIIAGPTNVTLPGSGNSISFTVPGTVNAAVGARAVVLTIITAVGTFTQEAVYGVRPTLRLVYLENSFMSYAQAQFVAQDIPNLTAWTGATDDARQTALIEAFARLKLQNYVIPFPELVDAQDYFIPGWVMRLEPRQWALMTVGLFESYPETFRDTLNKAQIVEANHLLDNSQALQKQRLGIFSEKVNETSVMFKSGVRPLDLGLARETFNVLSGYIENRYVLTRS